MDFKSIMNIDILRPALESQQMWHMVTVLRSPVGLCCRGTKIGDMTTMDDEYIPPEYYGWWRIVETSQWVDDNLDMLGRALISLTGHDDRLRMFCLLAHVNCHFV